MKPEFDFFGDKISEKIVFFKLPINIGEIIAAYSSLKDNDKPLAREKIISNKIKIYTPTVIICIFVVLILKQDLWWMFICLSIIFCRESKWGTWKDSGYYRLWMWKRKFRCT